MVSQAETKFIPRWYSECTMHFILYHSIFVSLHYLYILNLIYINITHFIYPYMLLMNLMLSALFPLPFPSSPLKLFYNTGMYNIFVKMVYCGCSSECGVIGFTN